MSLAITCLASIVSEMARRMLSVTCALCSASGYIDGDKYVALKPHSFHNMMISQKEIQRLQCGDLYAFNIGFYVDFFSARQHICYSALFANARPSVSPSVPLSVTRVDQSKTVEVRITQPSPQSSPMTLVS